MKTEFMLVDVIKNLKELENYAEQLSGEWDGDMPGTLEERASCCEEIMAHCKSLASLLEELKTY